MENVTSATPSTAPKPQLRWSPSARSEIVNYAKHHSTAEAARKYGCSISSIHSWKHELAKRVRMAQEKKKNTDPTQSTPAPALAHHGHPATLEAERTFIGHQVNTKVDQAKFDLALRLLKESIGL